MAVPQQWLRCGPKCAQSRGGENTDLSVVVRLLRLSGVAAQGSSMGRSAFIVTVLFCLWSL